MFLAKIHPRIKNINDIEIITTKQRGLFRPILA